MTDRTELPNISDIELAWLAGLLEGEGTFRLNRSINNEKLYLYPCIVISMVDKDVIDRVSALFNTSTYVIPLSSTRTGHQQQFRATVQGYKAAKLMELMFPFMGERRRSKIEEILKYYGDIEPTNVRRAKACSESATKRWKLTGTRTGKLPTSSYREDVERVDSPIVRALERKAEGNFTPSPGYGGN